MFLGKIEQESGYPVMSLPMLKGFHIDLGFPIDWGTQVANSLGRSVFHKQGLLWSVLRDPGHQDPS